MVSRARRPGGGAIGNVAQIRALRTPVRQEILDVAQALGPCSVADLARELARPADGLYYHVRALAAVGLLVEAGARGEGRRREVLYATPSAKGLRLVYDPADPDNAAAVVAAVGGMLRLTSRTFEAALQPGTATAGPRRELWAARNEGWLSGPELAEANDLLQRLRELFGRPRSEGKRRYALTFVLTPLRPAPEAPRGRRRRGPTADGS